MDTDLPLGVFLEVFESDDDEFFLGRWKKSCSSVGIQ